MVEFYQKRRIRRFLYSRPVVALLFVPMCAMVYASYGAYEKMTITAEKRMAVASEIEKLEARRNALALEIERLNTKRGVEEEIRQKFNLGHEGEKMLVIVEDEAAKTAAAEAVQKNEARRGVWDTLRSWF